MSYEQEAEKRKLEELADSRWMGRLAGWLFLLVGFHVCAASIVFAMMTGVYRQQIEFAGNISLIALGSALFCIGIVVVCMNKDPRKCYCSKCGSHQ